MQRGAIEQYNTDKEKALRDDVEKYEQDRIGQGRIASTAAQVLGKITDGKAGYTVGKPNNGMVHPLLKDDKK